MGDALSGSIGRIGTIYVWVALIATVAIVSKLVGCGIGALIRKIPTQGAVLIGVALCGRGALEFILIQSGLDRGLLSEDQFSTVILVVLISILLTPLLFRLVRSRVKTEGL